MKAAALQGFMRDWLAVRGLEPEVVEPEVWRFDVPKDLRERFGRSELTFSFSRRAIARNPRSELATVGNPIFDRLLAVAREEGRVGIGYGKVSSSGAKAPAPEKVPAARGTHVGKGEPVYQAIYHFIFTITYPSIEASDEMEVVSLDGGSLEVRPQTPDIAELWKTLEPVPRKGRRVLPPLPLSEKVLETALRSLEKRLRRRIKKVEQACGERLEAETGSIQAYYEQLIEETRNQSRRWSPRVEDREERIRWLQLEWKRRREEANAFWMPRVNARMVALGVQMQPRIAYRLLGAKAGARGAGHVPMRIWDEAGRTLLVPYCEECGRPGLDDPAVAAGGRLACTECAGKMKGPAGDAVGSGSAPLTVPR